MIHTNQNRRNVILYGDRPVVSDETVYVDRHDAVLIDRENKTALVTDTAVPFTP